MNPINYNTVTFSNPANPFMDNDFTPPDSPVAQKVSDLFEQAAPGIAYENLSSAADNYFQSELEAPQASGGSSSNAKASSYSYLARYGGSWDDENQENCSTSSSSSKALPTYSKESLSSPAPGIQKPDPRSLDRHENALFDGVLGRSPYAGSPPDSDQKKSLKRAGDVFDRMLSKDAPTPDSAKKRKLSTYVGKIQGNPSNKVASQVAWANTYEEAEYDPYQAVAKDYAQSAKKAKKKRVSLPPTPKYIFTNIHHVIDSSTKGGFHLCPQTNPMYSQLQDKVMSANGTFAASWSTPRSSTPKFSTFFPENIPDADALLDFFETFDPMDGIRQGNRELYTNGDLIVEMYHNSRGTINSAFPIFGYFDLSSDFSPLTTSYPLAQGMGEHDNVTQDRLINAVRSSRNAGVADVFNLEHTSIIDVAPFLGLPHVQQGIYVVVSNGVDFS